MAMAMIGADTDELRRIGESFTRHGREVAQVPGTLTPEVERPEMWIGPDATAFREHWSGTTVPGIDRLADILEAAALELGQQADAQDACSSGAGASAGAAAGAPATAAGSPSGGTSSPAPTGTLAQLGGVDGLQGMPAATRRDAWLGLAPAERTAAIQANPERVGAMDGVPFVDRAEANKLAAQRILDGGAEGLSPEARTVTEKVARGEIQTVLFQPREGNIVEMLNPPSERTRHTITMLPGTFGELADFNDHGATPLNQGDHQLARYLAATHPDTTVLIYQPNDWSKHIIGGLPDWAPEFKFVGHEGSNQNEIMHRNGAALAAFNRDAVGLEPDLARGSHAVMTHSYGNSVAHASEKHGSHYDRVVSMAGSNAPVGWEPQAGTKYLNVQHTNDALNVMQGYEPLSLLFPGASPDMHPAYDSREYGVWGPSKLHIPDWAHNIPGVRTFEAVTSSGAGAHSHINDIGGVHERPHRDVEHFLFDGDEGAAAQVRSGR